MTQSHRGVGLLSVSGSVLAAALAVSACGGQGHPPVSGSSTSVTTPVSSGGAAAANVAYQLHMDFFSHESNQASVIDPQVFVSTPGAPAGTGPQNIHHAAGGAPAHKSDPPDTALLAADATPLGITLGQWESAAGSLSLSCDGGQAKGVSQLRGLIPGGVYSVFVVHLNVQGQGRFTPFGDSAGTTNNFTAAGDGTASPTSTVTGCLSNQEAVLVIWHSDHRAHGASGGTLGVDWHNSLITPVP